MEGDFALLEFLVLFLYLGGEGFEGGEVWRVGFVVLGGDLSDLSVMVAVAGSVVGGASGGVVEVPRVGGTSYGD